MSALPLPSSSPPPAPRGVAWIDASEAASRYRCTDANIRQLCRGKWFASGHARQEVTGGCKVWMIREDADPKLARVKFADAMAMDWRQFNDDEREEIMRKRQTLKEWRAYLKSSYAAGKTAAQGTADFIALVLARDGVTLSPRTLRDWELRHRKIGVAGLVDGRRDRRQVEGAADLFLEEAKHLFLRKRQLKIKALHGLVCQKAAEKGWPWHSYFATLRFLNSLPPALVALRREGEEAFINRHEPFIERDYTTLASNELWCSDHHQFDVIVNDGGKLVRPWLTAWEDLRSRLIVGWRIFSHAPNTDTILASFRSAVLLHGVPQGIYIDNGKDYDSYALNGRTKADRFRKHVVRVEVDGERAGGVFNMLDVKVTHAWAYHGQSKPIERFFGTVEGNTPVWDTYCGRSTAHKPDDLELQLERGRAPALADFIDWFGAWVATHNAAGSHAQGLDGKSPDVVFAENLHTKRTATPGQLDAACLPRTKPVKVGQNGVTHKGIRYGQYENAFIPLWGKEVVLAIDDADITRVQVWTLENKLVCIATANRMLPANASSQELREAIKAKKQYKKTIQQFHEARPRMADDLPDQIVRARAAKNVAARAAAPEPEPPQPNIKPVRLPMEDQLPALQRAMERERPLRVAVGAESMSHEEFGRRLGSQDGAADEPQRPARFHYASPTEKQDEWESANALLVRAMTEKRESEPAEEAAEPFDALAALRKAYESEDES